jgi:glycosyltransferase involved in cell wall biosynthesis
METGGAEIMAIGLLNQICAGNEVSLIIINDKWNEKLLNQLDSRVKIYFIHRKAGSRSPLPILRLNMLLLRLNPDVLHSHDPNTAKVIKVPAGKKIHTVHDVGISTSMYHFFDSLVAISDAVYKDVQSNCGFPVEKIYNGIPVDAFKTRKEYNLMGLKQFRLIQVSRLMHEKKGQDVLLYAIHKLRTEHGFTDILLDFIGSGSSLDFLKELVTKLGLEENVRFLGEQDRTWLFANLCNYHVLVQPSRYEGFGLTILEGFAAGLPVLASDIDGPAEILAGIPAGFLFKNEDSASCADGLSQIISLYKNNQVSTLMAKTIEVVKDQYSLVSCASQYVKAYQTLLAS